MATRRLWQCKEKHTRRQFSIKVGTIFEDSPLGLDKWLAAISVSREKNAFIANIVKCRPPGNRDPQPEESEACFPYLERQIELVRPRSILAVGRIAAQRLIGSDIGIGKLRGKVYAWGGIPLIPTYHPSGVLRNPSLRGAVWEDLKRLRSLLDERASGEG